MNIVEFGTLGYLRKIFLNLYVSNLIVFEDKKQISKGGIKFSKLTKYFSYIKVLMQNNVFQFPLTLNNNMFTVSLNSDKILGIFHFY